MNPAFDHLSDLERQVQAMSRTESPAEVFKVLRDTCRFAAPRGGVFLIRQGKIQGWSAYGYEGAVVRAQREFTCGLQEGWFGELIARSGSPTRVRPAGLTDPSFGQSAADEAVGIVVRIQDKPIALVVIERCAGESPWFPEAIGLLGTVAQLRLELDLSLRKLSNAVAAAPTARTQGPSAASRDTAVDARPVDTASVTPTAAGTAPAVETKAVAPVAVMQEETETDPVLDAARRYARLVATDIRLYNEEAVALGRRNGDLVRRLEEHLGRGKETFLRRHGDLGPTGLELLHEAYIQVLAAGDAKLIPPGTMK